MGSPSEAEHTNKRGGCWALAASPTTRDPDQVNLRARSVNVGGTEPAWKTSCDKRRGSSVTTLSAKIRREIRTLPFHFRIQGTCPSKGAWKLSFSSGICLASEWGLPRGGRIASQVRVPLEQCRVRNLCWLWGSPTPPHLSRAD